MRLCLYCSCTCIFVGLVCARGDARECDAAATLPTDYADVVRAPHKHVAVRQHWHADVQSVRASSGVRGVRGWHFCTPERLLRHVPSRLRVPGWPRRRRTGLQLRRRVLLPRNVHDARGRCVPCNAVLRWRERGANELHRACRQLLRCRECLRRGGPMFGRLRVCRGQRATHRLRVQRWACVPSRQRHTALRCVPARVLLQWWCDTGTSVHVREWILLQRGDDFGDRVPDLRRREFLYGRHARGGRGVPGGRVWVRERP